MNTPAVCQHAFSYDDAGRSTNVQLSAKVFTFRGVARNLLEEQKRGSGRRKSPAGSRGRAPVGSGSEAPRSQRKMLISSYDGGHAPMSPLLATPLFTFSFEYLHIYSPNSGDFCRKK